MIKGFQAYDLAIQLHTECEAIRAKRHLKDQLNRAALSIVLNLAEGSGKMTPADKKRFYSIAFGSLRETQAILQLVRAEEAGELAHRLGGIVYRLIYPR